MIDDIYSGDPRIFLSEDGSRLYYRGGQPVMDQGLENSAFIDLFGGKDWAGNIFFDDNEEKLTSEFLEVVSGPITLGYLRDVEQSAELALSGSIYGNVTATATNPSSLITQINILIEPPGENPFNLVLTKDGINWQFQKLNPAHGRV